MSDKRLSLGVLAGLVVIVGVSYAPVRGYPYVQDAYRAVRENGVVARGSVREIFASDYWKGTVAPTHTLYRPVTVLSFALERRAMGELDPGVSHVLNAIFHAGAAWLLFSLARALGVGGLGSATAALGFAAHPLALQAVANVVGRADLLALVFGLGAVRLWVDEPRTPLGERGCAWGAGLLTFLALASKEIAIAIPPVLLAIDGIRRGAGAPAARDRIARYAPLALAVLVYVHLRTLAIGEFPGAQPVAAEDSVLVGLDGAARWATALAMAARYAGLFFLPTASSPDYSGGAIPVEPRLVAVAPLVGLGVLVFLAALAVRPWLVRADTAGRAASVAAWLTLVPYGIVSNLIVLNAAGFAERLVYVPLAGAMLLCGVGLEAAGGLLPAGARRPARTIAVSGVALAVALGAWQTRRQVPMWETGRALFEHTRRVTPKSLRGGLERATRLEAEGKLDEALEAWRSLTVSAPGYGGAWMSMGGVLVRLGRLDDAGRALERAIAIDPQVGEIRFRLALLRIAQGRLDEADRELRRALLLDPSLVEAAARLADLRFAAGRYRDAARLYRGCVDLGREDLRPRLREALALQSALPAGGDR